jgi:hypothetical protein
LLTAAGLVPIIIQLVKNAGANWAKGFDSGPLASLFVGIAAALLGLDKAFGYSSGWTRYVLTGTSMTKLLQEFRMDWLALSTAAAGAPNEERQAAMIQRAKEFVSTIQGMIAQETKGLGNGIPKQYGPDGEGSQNPVGRPEGPGGQGS